MSRLGEWTPKSVPASARSRCLNSSRVGGAGTVLGHLLRGHDEAVAPVRAGLGRCSVQLLRRRSDLRFGQQPLGPGGLAGKADLEQLPHDAPAAVAADKVAGAQPNAVGQLGGHPGVVLAQPGQLAAAPDLGAGFDGMLGRQALGEVLRDAENVGGEL